MIYIMSKTLQTYNSLAIICIKNVRYIKKVKIYK